MKSLLDYITESNTMTKAEAIALMKNEDIRITHKSFANNEFLKYETEDFDGKKLEEDDHYVYWAHGSVGHLTMQELEKELADKKYDNGWSEYKGKE